MSGELGPSTPGKKRSKWAEVEDYEAPLPFVPQLKRRVKPKIAKTTEESIPQPRPSPYRASASPGHSIYVPQRTRHPPIQPSRSVYSYERLNQIEEGSYGVVFRARDKQTGDIVALKKLKLDEEKNGFPITALREVYALMSCRHENVVGVREVVVGQTLTQCVPRFSF
jgi:cell division cycle 2-like protein